MNKAKETLDKWLLESGLPSYKELAIQLDVSPNTLDVWKQRGKIPEKNILKYTQYMGRINRPNKNEPKDMVSISYYPEVNASGGYGALNGDARFERMEVSRSFLSICFGLSNFANIDIIHVIGDSMEPFIQSGEIIILQRVDMAKNNQIVVARIDDEVYVKRLVKDPIAQCIKLTSENPYYPDMNLSSEDLTRVQIIGIVVGKIKAF